MVRKWENSWGECETFSGRENSEMEEDAKITWSIYWSPLLHTDKEKKEGGKYLQRHFQDLFVVWLQTSNYGEYCENTISVPYWQLALFLVWLLFYRQQVPSWSPRISGHSTDLRQLHWGDDKIVTNVPLVQECMSCHYGPDQWFITSTYLSLAVVFAAVRELLNT